MDAVSTIPDVFVVRCVARGSGPCELCPHHTTIRTETMPPTLLCVQLDCLWDTHPDKGDQCYFIKPRMRSGGNPGGAGCSSVSLLWEREAVRFSREKKRGLFFGVEGDTLASFFWPADGVLWHNGWRETGGDCWPVKSSHSQLNK